MQSSIGEPAAPLRASLATQAHLWLATPEAWTAEDFETLLAPAELMRARTLRNPLAQQNYVAGRALVRSALSHYADVSPSRWSFEANRLGRPEITGPRGIPPLRFNLSHTGGLAACVVTAAADCGVDVEEVERRLRPLRIAEHSFAAEEFADLETQPPAELRQRFFSYWTLKEAYYKGRGSGIPFRLGGARFGLAEADRVDFLPSDEEGVRADAWQFWLFRPTPAHMLAVAVDSGSASRLELRCFGRLEVPTAGATAPFSALALEAVRTGEAVPA